MRMDEALDVAFNKTVCEDPPDWNKTFLASLRASGYRVVPEVATQPMLDAMHDGFHAEIETGVSFVNGQRKSAECAVIYCLEPQATWSAMLAAAEEENG